MLKPGTLVLYIDNAAGGFTEAVERAAVKNDLRVIVRKQHVHYENESFKTERFKSYSCYKTKVTILLLQKKLRKNCVSFTPVFNRSLSQIRATNHPIQLRNNFNSESVTYVVKDDNLNRLKTGSRKPSSEDNKPRSVFWIFRKIVLLSSLSLFLLFAFLQKKKRL